MELLTKSDLVAMFHIKPRTVNLWMKVGRIPRPTYIGRRPYWHKPALDRHLKTLFGQPSESPNNPKRKEAVLEQPAI